MSSKNDILNKLRSAKSVDKKSGSEEVIPAIVPDNKIYSDYNTDASKMLEQFVSHQKNLHGEVTVCQSAQKMADKLADYLKEFGPGSVKYDNNDLLNQLLDLNPDLRTFLETENDLSINSPDYSNYEAGISGAEYLIARTGSIFLNSRMSGGRRLSVLPPVHIVLARRSQLVSSLDDVFKSIKSSKIDWSYATIITGPSRTADIEKILVLGAHGPKRLITLIQ
jgi:L-lactate dehydrogenase complex protein LldG